MHSRVQISLAGCQVKVAVCKTRRGLWGIKSGAPSGSQWCRHAIWGVVSMDRRLGSGEKSDISWVSDLTVVFLEVLEHVEKNALYDVHDFAVVFPDGHLKVQSSKLT